jgi:predicted TPR repeat methyltransferase
VPARASDAYIRAEFDNFAGGFDAKLANLEYRGPLLVSQAAGAIADQLAPQPIVLDAGCGTGLCGPLLRPLAGRLVGVDLSEKMAALARQRAEYDEIAVAELTEFLRQHRRSFDLVASADTLLYFGDLSEVMTAAAAALRSRGALIFTVERAEPGETETGYRLRPSGRYSHTRDYLATVLARAGFTDIDISEASPRKEVERWVPGWLVRARIAAGE